MRSPSVTTTAYRKREREVVKKINIYKHTTVSNTKLDISQVNVENVDGNGSINKTYH